MPASSRTTSSVSSAVVARSAPRPMVAEIALSASSSRLRRSSAARGLPSIGTPERAREGCGRNARTTPASTTTPPPSSASSSQFRRRSARANSRTGSTAHSAP